MKEKKVIVVIGATGAQGGGLAHAILEDSESEFSVRAVTRNPDSEKVRQLAALGAEVVKGDLEDPASIEKAFEDAYGAFCVTHFWEHFSPETERRHAETMARAAQKSGLQHVIWSTLEDTRNWIPLDDSRMPTLMDRYKVPHFDSKGESNAYFRDLGVPTTFLHTSFYWDNFIHFGMAPRRGEDGVHVLALPMGDAALPGICADDIGRCAYGIFKKGASMIGKTVGISGDNLTGQQMADAFSKVLGEDVRYYAVPFDDYRNMDFPGAEDLGNMFQFKHDFADDFQRVRQPDKTRELHPMLKDFETWLEENREEIKEITH